MKQKLTMASLVLLIFLTGAWTSEPKDASVNFYNGSYDNFLREAKKQQKPIILDFWATWCGPCKKLDRETFTDDAFASYLNENFLIYKVIIDSFDGIEIVERFEVKNFPTLLVADYRGNEVSKLKGFYYANYLQNILEDFDETYQLTSKIQKEQIVMNK
jgi:thioredoxin 1